MIHYIKVSAYADFDIDKEAFPDLEVVESGQPNNVNGQHAELAPALEPSGMTIEEKYGGRYNQTAFYVRMVPRHLVRRESIIN